MNTKEMRLEKETAMSVARYHMFSERLETALRLTGEALSAEVSNPTNDWQLMRLMGFRAGIETAISIMQDICFREEEGIKHLIESKMSIKSGEASAWKKE